MKHYKVDMDDHWDQIRLLIITSRFEGLPMVALEAMARGIPIVSTKAGALPELLNKAGLGKTFYSNDITGLRKAAERWMNMENHQYLAHAKQIKRLVEKEYNPERRIPEVLNTYRNAISNQIIQKPKVPLA